jgi:predicted NAD/FAD-binding protein
MVAGIRFHVPCSQIFGDDMTSPLDKKLKIKGPVLVTANRLADGAVIYRTAEGDWSTQFDRAAVVTTAGAATAMLDAAIADDVGAVGAYVAPVNLDHDGTMRPGNLRERIRLAGPTIDLPVLAAPLAVAGL